MIDKDALLRVTLTTVEVDLPSGAGTVLVRGLTRQEAVEVQAGLEPTDVEQLEVRGVARGLVEPRLTEDEVRLWRMQAPAADVHVVSAKISELSNLDPSGGKGPTSRSRTKG